MATEKREKLEGESPLLTPNSSFADYNNNSPD
jgi:hypothetical protein